MNDSIKHRARAVFRFQAVRNRSSVPHPKPVGSKDGRPRDIGPLISVACLSLPFAMKASERSRRDTRHVGELILAGSRRFGPWRERCPAGGTPATMPPHPAGGDDHRADLCRPLAGGIAVSTHATGSGITAGLLASASAAELADGTALDLSRHRACPGEHPGRMARQSGRGRRQPLSGPGGCDLAADQDNLADHAAPPARLATLRVSTLTVSEGSAA